MDFKINRIPNSNLTNYKRKDLDLAYDFAKKSYKEFGDFIKSIILYGSMTNPDKKEGDIDILIVIDDVTVRLNAQFVEAYRVVVEKIILNVSPKLHVNTMKLTNFFEYVKVGDPIAINMLRDGIPLVDTGFFEPLQQLLKQGRIKPTKESVWAYYTRAPMTLQNAKWHILQAVLDLYWGVIDASHAALMSIDVTPPSPDHVADLIDEKLVKPGHLPKKYSNTMRTFYELSRKILHREVQSMHGIDYDRYYAMADEYIKKMRDFIEKNEK
ncbi:MAG: nucleotidyltransferase domain-containing protein [Candidatus Woesearchaeota archaeon]